jgi:putative membrane protein
MHNRTLIALLAGTTALAVASATWAQSTPSTVGSATTGSTTTEDRAMGTSTTGTSTTGTSTTTSSPTTSDTTATTDSGSGNTNTNSPTGTTSASGAYGTTTSGSTGRAASLAGTDATFLRKAMEGGLEEVQRAQAAMRSAQRAEVRNVASMMLEDHRRTNEKLTQLASSKGWDVPSTASSAESDQSRIAAGPGFDDNYLEDEIRHHRETISLFRAQASSGSDPELRQFARDTLPALEHHLEMLQGSYSAK